MKHFATLVLVGMLSGAGFGQAGGANAASAANAGAGETDAQVLREILVEMRGLHNDVRLSETTQILLTELEVQHGAVDKAMEKRDTARNRVSSLQMNEKNFAAQVAQLEDSASATIDPAQQKRIVDQEQILKTNIANFKSQETDAATALQDAEGALRKEQNTLQGIQEQLDDVVKRLQPAQ